MRSFLKSILIIFVRAYRLFISPFTVPACRFHPSCSEYAIEALQKHGAFKGTYLATRRLLCCHPFSNKSGYDPVPENLSQRSICSCSHQHPKKG